jgi:3-hydroxybutyryl-CoA dehydrogenase
MTGKVGQRALIVGGGTMGTGIAAAFIAGGWTVDVVSRSSATRAGVPAKVEAMVRQCGKPFAAEALAVHADYGPLDWSRIAIVVENVSEDLELKRTIFAELARTAPARVALTSNTSSYPISDIARGLPTPERMLGLHFYMPAHLVPLVEVIRGEATEFALAETVGEWMWQIGKRPVQVKKDIPGFLANRIQAAMMREALWLIDQGIASAEDVDAAVRYSFGMRLAAAGPILQKDHSGWNTTEAVARSMYPHLATIDGPPKVLTDMVAAGNWGMRTGCGFYQWSDEAIARERKRYDEALKIALSIFEKEGLR